MAPKKKKSYHSGLHCPASLISDIFNSCYLWTSSIIKREIIWQRCLITSTDMLFISLWYLPIPFWYKIVPYIIDGNVWNVVSAVPSAFPTELFYFSTWFGGVVEKKWSAMAAFCNAWFLFFPNCLHNKNCHPNPHCATTWPPCLLLIWPWVLWPCFPWIFPG